MATQSTTTTEKPVRLVSTHHADEFQGPTKWVPMYRVPQMKWYARILLNRPHMGFQGHVAMESPNGFVYVFELEAQHDA